MCIHTHTPVCMHVWCGVRLLASLFSTSLQTLPHLVMPLKGQLSADTVGAIWKVGVLIRLWKQHSVYVTMPVPVVCGNENAVEVLNSNVQWTCFPCLYISGRPCCGRLEPCHHFACGHILCILLVGCTIFLDSVVQEKIKNIYIYNLKQNDY